MSSAIEKSGVRLTVGGEQFETWQEYSIELSLLNIPSAFSLRAPNDDGSMSGVVNPGDEVKLSVDGTQQLVGRVDEVRYDCDPDSGATVEISGRDKALFLQDCYPLPQIFRNKTLKQIAESLTSQWISSWECDETLERISYLKVEPGQTIIDILFEQAKKNNMLIWMDAEGHGRIGKPNYDQDPLYELHRHPKSSEYRGMNNIISGSITDRWNERYSAITVYGSQGGTQANYAKSVRSKSTATDSSEGWYSLDRRMIINDSNVKNLKQAKQLAELEVARRKFDGWIAEYTVAGHYGWWLDSDGTKEKNQWWIDTRVTLLDEVAGYKGIYYVVKRRFYCNENGQFTDLELRPDSVWLT